MFLNPLIQLFASPLIIKGAVVYCEWSAGNQLLSSFLSGDARLLRHSSLFTPRLIWNIMDTRNRAFSSISPKAYKRQVSLWRRALWNISLMALVHILKATVDAWIGVPAYRCMPACVRCICMACLDSWMHHIVAHAIPRLPPPPLLFS